MPRRPRVFFRAVSELTATLLLAALTAAAGALILLALNTYASGALEAAAEALERAGPRLTILDAYYLPGNNTVVVVVYAGERVELERAYVDGKPAAPVSGFDTPLPAGKPVAVTLQPPEPLEPGPHRVTLVLSNGARAETTLAT